jgi:hypothetical protein
MFLNILSLLALWALAYWTLYVLPKKANRVVSIISCFLLMIALSEMTKWGLAHPDSFPALLRRILMAGKIIAGVGFMNPISHIMVERLAGFHRESNAENLHRFPVSFLDQNEDGIKKVATGFWFVSSLYEAV